jgi:hypothetical protein
VDVPEPEAEARYDPRIEAAVYFSCVEALRAATASTVIHVQAGADALHFSIDDLQGVARGSMQASADRIAALDGSLLLEEGAVSGQLPLRVPA